LAQFDLTTRKGRLKTYLDMMWKDHAFLRVGFQNAHWVGDKLIRTNQPWPFQLKWWRDHGVKTVINLRGGGYETSFYVLEREACKTLGLNLVNFVVSSREAPTAQQVLDAQKMFNEVEYPAIMHCKSGADRAGIMAVLYSHLHLGKPLRQALKDELSLRTLHMSAGKTGVLDYTFERYFAEGEPKGLSFVEWVQQPGYDHVQLKKDFQANWLGSLLTEKILRRE
jgi:protein tyrosine/serine phosphatase